MVTIAWSRMHRNGQRWSEMLINEQSCSCLTRSFLLEFWKALRFFWLPSSENKLKKAENFRKEPKNSEKFFCKTKFFHKFPEIYEQ